MDERSSKRRKFNEAPVQHVSPFTSVDQLQEALRFHQNVTPEVKTNVNMFKDFLSSARRDDNLAAQAQQLKILREYCNSQSAPSKEHVDFPDLLSTWSFAVQSNSDSICSAVPAALAQFFRTISGLLEFRDFGLSLCHSLLKRDQLRLFDRGLSASKSKEHLISPCLRLLSEIISFDGGTLAGPVYARRDFLFKRLDALLEFRPSHNAENDRRSPSVRRMALRVMIANLKFLDPASKNEFLAQNRLFRATFRALLYDGDDIIADVLSAVESGVFNDPDIPRNTKVRFFNQENLTAIASLYAYEPDSVHVDSDSQVRENVHQFLVKICAPRKGICIPQNSWYPLGYDLNMETAAGHGDDFIDLGLDSPLYFDEYKTSIPVKNGTLSSFIQALKPDSDSLQRELLLTIFENAPELVADYFSKKKFSSAPGDDAQWRGQFAVMFGVVQLSVPRNLDSSERLPSLPPPTSIVIDSIIPRPLDRATLTRCFSLNDEILMISASRLLSLALKKLQEVLKTFARGDENIHIWRQASRRLTEAVLERCARYKDIVEAFQRCSKGNGMLRSAIFECIAAIHQALPEAIAQSKFDVGPILQEVLSQIDPADVDKQQQENLIEQIGWLVQIAQLSPATKWWSKSGSDSFSLFSTVLRFSMLQHEHVIGSKVMGCLSMAISGTEILNTCTDAVHQASSGDRSPNSFSALQRSLRATKNFSPSDEVYLFMDNCIHRAIQKPVRYLDQLEATQMLLSDRTPLSLLACSVAEQWGFALKKYEEEKKVLKNIARWIARFYNALDNAGENFRVMNHFRQDMEQIANEKTKDYLESAFEKTRKRPVDFNDNDSSTIRGDSPDQSEMAASSNINTVERNGRKATADLEQTLGLPTSVPHSLEGLDRYDAKTDLEHAIQSGRVSRLILCTSSPSEEVRLAAFASLQNLTHVINDESNTYAEKSQVQLLLGELSETIRQQQQQQQGRNSPLPSIVAELASRLTWVLSDPSHKIFGKANKFLLRSPSWNVEKLIPHWIDKLIYREPEKEDEKNNNAWAEEVEWLLEWMVAGLKLNSDLEIYRRSGAWEKILSVYVKPGLSRNAKRSILSMVWRAGVCLEGGDDDDDDDASSSGSSSSSNNDKVNGADTLITRAGVHRWLEAVAVTERDNFEGTLAREVLKELMTKRNKKVFDRWERNVPALRGKNPSVTTATTAAAVTVTTV